MGAFETYLVMQIDSLRLLFGLLGGGLLFACVLVGILILRDDVPDVVRRWWPRVALVGVVLGTLTAIVPSSTTLAAMYVLPKLTTPEATTTISQETREIYELAKRGLRKLIEEK